METSGPGDLHVGAKERKKIQFAVPSSAPTQLDPRQVEMIRRRRPTPATLFRVADQSSPEDDNSTHQWVVGENGVLKPKRVNPSVYQPPSLKAVQQMAEAQMQKLGVYTHMEEEGEEPLEALEEEQLLSCPTAPQADMSKTDDQSDSSDPKVVEQTEEEDEEDGEAAEDESRHADAE
ncbi:protein phosphatase 1 regulatory subunit 1B [Brachyhypopomus gauderio]|uniref:protein phosphatase 1 regulatory subunit 1B n=1 Tax=Brachyhypopomus gauderio TaxID=698409 RepID=UPI004043573D